MSEQDPFQELLEVKAEPCPQVRQIILPSGRSLEVVSFAQTSDRKREQGLHVCPECASDHVQPTRWKEEASNQWHLDLHCPNCDWLGDGVYSESEVDNFEVKLDEGLSQMLDDLRSIIHFIMSEEIELFGAALQADHILPEDF